MQFSTNLLCDWPKYGKIIQIVIYGKGNSMINWLMEKQHKHAAEIASGCLDCVLFVGVFVYSITFRNTSSLSYDAVVNLAGGLVAEPNKIKTHNHSHKHKYTSVPCKQSCLTSSCYLTFLDITHAPLLHSIISFISHDEFEQQSFLHPAWLI